MNNYDVGDLVRLTCSFRNSSDALADPTTVTLKVRKGGSTTTYTDATKDSTGVYHRDFSIDQAGIWQYRWIGTGTVETAEEGSFAVRTPAVT